MVRGPVQGFSEPYRTFQSASILAASPSSQLKTEKRKKSLSNIFSSFTLNCLWVGLGPVLGPHWFSRLSVRPASLPPLVGPSAPQIHYLNPADSHITSQVIIVNFPSSSASHRSPNRDYYSHPELQFEPSVRGLISCGDELPLFWLSVLPLLPPPFLSSLPPSSKICFSLCLSLSQETNNLNKHSLRFSQSLAVSDCRSPCRPLGVLWAGLGSWADPVGEPWGGEVVLLP